MENTVLSGNGIYYIRFWNDIYLHSNNGYVEQSIYANHKNPVNKNFGEDCRYWWYIEGNENDLTIKPAGLYKTNSETENVVYDTKAIDVQWGSTSSADIWLYSFNNTLAQKFKIEKSHQPNFYLLIPKCAPNLLFTIGENQEDDQCSLIEGKACTRPPHKYCMNNQLIQFIKITSNYVFASNYKSIVKSTPQPTYQQNSQNQPQKQGYVCPTCQGKKIVYWGPYGIDYSKKDFGPNGYDYYTQCPTCQGNGCKYQ